MPRPPSSLQIRLLGPLEVMVAGRPVVVDTRKALAIVALVAAEGRPFARDELAAMFWPDADDEAARLTVDVAQNGFGGDDVVEARTHWTSP